MKTPTLAAAMVRLVDSYGRKGKNEVITTRWVNGRLTGRTITTMRRGRISTRKVR